MNTPRYEARETLQQHYNRVYRACQAKGFAEPISLAPAWQTRADALYAEINAMGECPREIGLLSDGRMAVYGETLGVCERA
jgi:hypothetical protein